MRGRRQAPEGNRDEQLLRRNSAAEQRYCDVLHELCGRDRSFLCRARSNLLTARWNTRRDRTAANRRLRLQTRSRTKGWGVLRSGEPRLVARRRQSSIRAKLLAQKWRRWRQLSWGASKLDFPCVAPSRLAPGVRANQKKAQPRVTGPETGTIARCRSCWRPGPSQGCPWVPGGAWKARVQSLRAIFCQSKSC